MRLVINDEARLGLGGLKPPFKN